MGWTVKGKSFITCDREDGYLRKLEDFETDSQIHPSFLEMTPHKIQLLWKFPPSDCCGNSLCTDSPYRFFLREEEVVCTQATVETTNIPATNPVACRTDVIFHVFPGNKTKQWRLVCRLQMLAMFTTYVTYSRVSKINVYYLRMIHSISVYASKCFVLLSWNLLKWPPR